MADPTSETCITPNQFLDERQLATAAVVADSQRAQMGRWLNGNPSTPPPPISAFLPQPALPPLPTAGVAAGGPGPISNAALAGLLPAFMALVARIRQELDSNPARLLSLNQTRRASVAQHLESLAEGPSGQQATVDSLKRWVDPVRSPAQNSALQRYFEELALFVLGQALVLKAWSDRGVRPWRREDLADLNWSLSQVLRPHLTFDRVGWQLTQQNIYSWYKPGLTLQQEIWDTLGPWPVGNEGPLFLSALLRTGRQFQPRNPEAGGYDTRFLQSLWDASTAYGFDSDATRSSALRRSLTVFTPTLRDGSLLRSSPEGLTWVGLEACPLQLYVAELVQLWWGPRMPPVWALGTGLEVHSRDQLQLALGSPKPTLYQRIADMEACDAAVVLEERSHRASARSPDGARLRDQLDSFPYFRKLRTAGTSLGVLQACVAITKLRPGGLLWWIREEPLADLDGKDALGFLLDRGKLLAEWDLSALEHSLPVSAPLFPRYLYLWTRDSDLAARSAHRPARVVAQGQIRSHVELPHFLGDCLLAPARETGLARPHSGRETRVQWQLHVRSSPSAQREWADHWPDPSEPETVRRVEALRSVSTPLVAIATIRRTPDGEPWTAPAGLRGFWIRAESSPEGRRLVACDLPNAGMREAASGFLVLISDENGLESLRAYLETDSVRVWLDHHAERKSDRWVLGEQLVKFIPVPKALAAAFAPANADESVDAQISTLAHEAPYRPESVAERLEALVRSRAPEERESFAARARATIFVQAARARASLRASQARLLSMVRPDSNSGRGGIRWRLLLEILPKGQLVPVTLHPDIRMQGSNLPPHQPIARIEKKKHPSPGYLFMTESGFSLKIESSVPRLIEILDDQLLDAGDGPFTWSELSAYLCLPRNLELAETTAMEILRSHGEQTSRLKALADLLAACTPV